MPTATHEEVVVLPDGRELAYATLGASEGPAVVFHHGTPGASFTAPGLHDAAQRAGVRIFAPTRSGYGGSSRDADRAVASVVPDVLAMLDAQGVDRFATAGWSGGGPHALACAALAPERCAAALSLAGVAPYFPDEFDWLGGMGEENVDEFTLAMKGGPELDAALEVGRELLLSLDYSQVGSARDLLGGLVSDEDNAAATPADMRFMCELVERGVGAGVGGWRDDDRAFVQPWGFDVTAISVPVALWFGDHDLMVPPQHGQWLAEHVPGAVVRRVHDGGHLSIVFGHYDEHLAVLVELAGGTW